MVSVLIDKNTKKIISIVEGQKLKSTPEYDVYHTEKTNEFEILKELFNKNILNKSFSFDVIFKRDSLGDVLMLMPVIVGIKSRYPYLKIALQTDKWLVPLFENLSFLDGVIPLSTRSSASYEIDLRKIGDFIALEDGGENQHRTFYYEDYVKTIMIDYNFTSEFNHPFYFNSDDKILFELPTLEKLVILAPRSKSYLRMWGYRDDKQKKYYPELELIKRKKDWNFVVLHSIYLEDFDGFENVTNLSGKTNIIECATICKNAMLGIVPDSGIMHLLGLLNIPTIAIFGNVTKPSYRISNYKNVHSITTPVTLYNKEKYDLDPYCHIPCCWQGQIHDCVGEKHEKWCIKEITIDKVLDVYSNIEAGSTNKYYIESESYLNKLITYVFISDTNIKENLDIIEYYKQNGIKNIKFFTSKDVKIEEVVKINPIKNIHHYSKFILMELYSHIETEYVLISQWDGFILDFTKWDDNFFDYDYIGAHWFWKDYSHLGGNGGFSLRSKKFLHATSFLDLDCYSPEDEIISNYGKELEKDYGIKFAPIKVMNKFSVEDSTYKDQFGFHRYNTKNLPITSKSGSIKLFAHSGNLGDVIYSLPFIKEMGGGVLYLVADENKYEKVKKLNLNDFNMIKKYVNSLDYILEVCFVEKGFPTNIDYDLSLFRETYEFLGRAKWDQKWNPDILENEEFLKIRKRNLIDLYFHIFDKKKIKIDKWLASKKTYRVDGKCIIVNKTCRYGHDDFPWNKIINKYSDRVIFLGFEEEYDSFIKLYGYVDYINNFDLIDIVAYLNGCDLFIGNQSFLHSLATGLDINTIQETSKYIPNCLFEKNNLYLTDTDEKRKFENIDKFIIKSLDFNKSSTKLRSIEKGVDKYNIKSIAMMLPQFHPIPENDKSWGKGFTEWTLMKNCKFSKNGNVIKQPHKDLGYYDPTTDLYWEFLEKTVNDYNVYGLCFYHYWFDYPVMYRPAEKWLNGNYDVNICFAWANESWTAQWDGSENEVLLLQSYGREKYWKKHFKYLLPFFQHDNYIKVGGKPVFLIYRPFEEGLDIKGMMDCWNHMIQRSGFSGIEFLFMLGSTQGNNPRIDYSLSDGLVEFNPNYLGHHQDIITFEDKYLSAKKEEAYKVIENNPKKHYNYFRGTFTHWDNSPRRNRSTSTKPMIFNDTDPNLFKSHMENLIETIKREPNIDNNWIFINAWNEWGEGAILEPDNIHGYAYLDIVKELFS
tara:strand:+ start:323 stop:3958 length:3636 start_codon:yes stop_codon:yes gene_type:complete